MTVIYRNPPIVLDEMSKAREALRDHGQNYAKARIALVNAEIVYEKQMATVFVSLWADAQKSKARMPGEDVRQALGHVQMDQDVWRAFLMAKADVDALDRLIRVEANNLSALQSELGQLRDELKFAG